MVTNVNMCNYCAFCKFWYDPTNSAIKPIDVNRGLWEFDRKAIHQCTKLRVDRQGCAVCSKFELKL